MRPLFALLLAAGLLAGCASTVNTLPPPSSPRAATDEYVLDLPEGLEIRSVDYDATVAGNVSGAAEVVSTSIYGRAFVKVFAVERATGEEVLLIYENLGERSTPVQIMAIIYLTNPS